MAPIQHLRTPRLIFFALTMALSIVVTGLTSWGIKVAYGEKHETSKTLPGATLHVQDLLGSGGAVTAASVSHQRLSCVEDHC